MFKQDYLSAAEVLKYNNSTGHSFYCATITVDGKEKYLARKAGYHRWNDNLADALAGGGYFIAEEYAIKEAESICSEYKDYSIDQVEIKKIDVSKVIPLLIAGFYS